MKRGARRSVRLQPDRGKTVRELRLRRRRSRVPWVYLVYHWQEPEPFGTFEPFGAFETFF